MDKQTFDRQFEEFANQSIADGRFSPKMEEQWFFLNDDTQGIEDFNSAYVMHCAWAARVLAETKPVEHTDIGSYVYFVTMVSAFVPIRSYEFRPVNFKLSGLTGGKADLVHLPFPNNSIPSLSCMHTMEHVGLGRYGDPIDASGDRKAAAELARVLSFGGQLLMVLPMSDRPRVEFNGHRNYSYDHVMEMFPVLKLKEFSLVRGNGILKNASPSDVGGMECGCFIFTKA
jgi:hypothetical protein